MHYPLAFTFPSITITPLSPPCLLNGRNDLLGGPIRPRKRRSKGLSCLAHGAEGRMMFVHVRAARQLLGWLGRQLARCGRHWRLLDRGLRKPTRAAVTGAWAWEFGDMFRRGNRARKSSTIAVSSRYYCMAGFIVLRSFGEIGRAHV